MTKQHVDCARDAIRAAIDLAVLSKEPYCAAREALADLYALATQMHWLPIETAPKLPGSVLLWYPPKGPVPGECAEGEWSAVQRLWVKTRNAAPLRPTALQPTHWMPLPEGPCTPKE
jgi:hypothetical protein